MSLKAHFLLAAAGVLVLSGCATAPARTYQPETNSLNSRVSNLENQLSSKDAEISRLQGEMSAQSAALRQMQSENESLNQKLSDASSKLSASASKPAVKAYDSDLK